MFKDKLKELRTKKGISQYELAEKLFVSRSAIAKWENGNGIPSAVNLEAICEYFGVEEEWLLDRKDMKEIVEKLDKIGYHSLECWGGATFDSCLRFLNEDP